MTQRKLTDDELTFAKQALFELGKVSGCWEVYSKLRDMVREGTTNGQPYVEPDPPMPDGYRLAVAGDEGRADCLLLHCSEWMNREPGGKFMGGCTCIVPADRTPTDEDAAVSPRIEVMVRDDAEDDWKKRVLAMVLSDNASFRFLITDTERSGYSGWRHCRHLYPGE